MYVHFVVDENGDVAAAWVGQGVSPALDREALRVARLAKYSPALKDGKPVKALMTLPVSFRTR